MAPSKDFDVEDAIVLVVSEEADIYKESDWTKDYPDETKCYVHRKLLERHSAKAKELIEAEETDASGRKVGRAGNGSQVLCITIPIGPLATRFWCRYLYNRPMCIEDESVFEDYDIISLSELCCFCEGEDVNAADICVDELKRLFSQDTKSTTWLRDPDSSRHWLEFIRGNRTLTKMIVGMLVVKNTEPPFGMAKWLESLDNKAGQSLYKKVSMELARSVDRVTNPAVHEKVDHWERRRYHGHVAKGEPCYLDG